LTIFWTSIEDRLLPTYRHKMTPIILTLEKRNLSSLGCPLSPIKLRLRNPLHLGFRLRPPPVLLVNPDYIKPLVPIAETKKTPLALVETTRVKLEVKMQV
jgi:hypothetical protein